MLIDINTTLDASGGENDEISEEHTGDVALGALQYEVAGSTDVDVLFQVRLSPAASWVTWDGVSVTGASDGASDVVPVDTANLHSIRVVITNNDASNEADVLTLVRSDG